LLKALILYAKYELHPDNRNLPGILDFLQEFDPEQGEDDDESELDKQFLILNRKHPARRAYELGYKKAKGDMQGSIIMSLLTTIADFVDEEVAEFTKCSDFHLRDIGRKKIALYVIIPAMDNSWEGLVNILFSQLFNELYDLAAENHAKLPVSVSFFLDEFVNLGKFPNYEEFLATCRGYGIGVSTIIQSITQLQDKYNDKKAESILANCAVKICLNASNL
ncbi:type IV secretory system conjugative DNA transfer family protein, partial [Listeria booriae]